MSNQAKSVLAYGSGFLAAVAGIALAGWVCVLIASTVGAWWSGLWHVDEQEREEFETAAKKREANWSRDPRNPKVAGQKCLDLGGVPRYSAWTGQVVECNKPGANQVNIHTEVNQ